MEIEVEAVDERGYLREVRLSVGCQLVQRKVSFPFQMRWYPESGLGIVILYNSATGADAAERIAHIALGGE